MVSQYLSRIKLASSFHYMLHYCRHVRMIIEIKHLINWLPINGIILIIVCSLSLSLSLMLAEYILLLTIQNLSELAHLEVV